MSSAKKKIFYAKLLSIYNSMAHKQLANAAWIIPNSLVPEYSSLLLFVKITNTNRMKNEEWMKSDVWIDYSRDSAMI